MSQPKCRNRNVATKVSQQQCRNDSVETEMSKPKCHKPKKCSDRWIFVHILKKSFTRIWQFLRTFIAGQIYLVATFSFCTIILPQVQISNKLPDVRAHQLDVELLTFWLWCKSIEIKWKHSTTSTTCRLCHR